jgi:transposase
MHDDMPPVPDISQEDWAATPHIVLLVLMLMQYIQQLTQRIADLEARLNQHSGNSSTPPSSDPPSAPPKPPRTPRGKRRGGQPGHPGQHRPLLPPEQVDEIVTHAPSSCPHCTADLPTDLPDAAPAQRHQVTEVPPIQPHVTEHRLRAVCCPHCQRQVRASLPDEVPSSAFGPRLTALTALLHGRYRLSDREVVEVLADVVGVEMSLGSVVTCCDRVSTALEPVYDALVETLPQQPVVHVDETSWKEANQRCWLWVVVGAAATVFRIAASRGKQVWQGMLGDDYAGILTSDRLAAYNAHPLERRQLCWAHIQRNLRAIAEQGRDASLWASEALCWVQLMFAIWHQYAEGAIDRATLQAALEPVQDALWECLQRGQAMRWEKARKLATRLWQQWDGLWTFAQVDGVEPTNNAAERAVRPAVLWRKGCFGTQSEAGSRFVERLLTVSATCRQHDKHLLSFLTAAVDARWSGQPAPTLVGG